MSIEFNITAADKFFLGEDKVVDFTIFGADNVTPYDVSALPLEWSLRKTDKAPDPPLILKSINNGLSIIGIYNADPVLNTQRVRITFASADTDPVATVAANPSYKLTANFAYRHSLKRMDTNNEGIFSYGSMTFLQATER